MEVIRDLQAQVRAVDEPETATVHDAETPASEIQPPADPTAVDLQAQGSHVTFGSQGVGGQAEVGLRAGVPARRVHIQLQVGPQRKCHSIVGEPVDSGEHLQFGRDGQRSGPADLHVGGSGAVIPGVGSGRGAQRQEGYCRQLEPLTHAHPSYPWSWPVPSRSLIGNGT